MKLISVCSVLSHITNRFWFAACNIKFETFFRFAAFDSKSETDRIWKSETGFCFITPNYENPPFYANMSIFSDLQGVIRTCKPSNVTGPNDLQVLTTFGKVCGPFTSYSDKHSYQSVPVKTEKNCRLAYIFRSFLVRTSKKTSLPNTQAWGWNPRVRKHIHRPTRKKSDCILLRYASLFIWNIYDYS